MNTLNAFAIVVPTIAVLFGILMNRQDALAIRAEMKEEFRQVRNEMKSELGNLRSDVKADINQVRNEMVQLRNSIHTDMVGIHERTAVLETKQA